MQRMQLADSLARQLERLGLERRAKPVPTLGNHLASTRSPDPMNRSAVSAETGTP